MVSLPPFALRKALERSNFNETGKLKKRDKGGRKKMTQSWLFTLSSVIHSNSPLSCRQPLPGRQGENAFKGPFSLNRECSVIYSFLPHGVEIAVQNGKKRPVMAGIATRVSYVLLKQIIFQNEKKKGNMQKKKKRRDNVPDQTWTQRVITSLREVTWVLSAVVVMSELPERERSVSIQLETFVPKHNSDSPLQLPFDISL